MPRRTRVHAHAVVLGDRREAPLDAAGVRVDHRRHPIDAPPARGAAEPAKDLVDADHEVRLVVAVGEPGSEPARVRQRANEHVGLLTPRCIVELKPVPLDLLTRRVLDVDMRASVGRRARLAVRAQLPVAELTGEGLVAALVPECHQLVEQRGRPHVLIISQPLTHVRLEPIERIRLGALAHARLALA